MTPRSGPSSGSRRGRNQGSRRISAVIIGGGHNGLAMSHCLAGLGIDHVVLERGEVANAWRRERWDSLRLLTPNWQTRLPGHAYAGRDPDGFMTMPEVIGFIEEYARLTAAPVQAGTTVTAVHGEADGYRVVTDQGTWRSAIVVLASGAFGIPNVPECAAGLPATVRSLTTAEYKRPAQLPEGGVLVVGASATGVQLAEEIQASGRPVTLAAGEHVRMPRRYRGRDVQWWMDATGVLDKRHTDVDDVVRARRVSSPQLIGSDDHRTLDLNALRQQGVGCIGRLASIQGGRALFSGSLRNQCALADLKMNRLLDSFDQWACRCGVHDALAPPERFLPTIVDHRPPLEIDLTSGEIRTVIWATGYRQDLSWLQVPVLDRKGRLQHDGGVTDSPGLVALGLPFLRRRKSSFMHGSTDDVRDLAQHLKGHLDSTVRRINAGMVGA